MILVSKGLGAGPSVLRGWGHSVGGLSVRLGENGAGFSDSLEGAGGRSPSLEGLWAGLSRSLVVWAWRQVSVCIRLYHGECDFSNHPVNLFRGIGRVPSRVGLIYYYIYYYYVLSKTLAKRLQQPRARTHEFTGVATRLTVRSLSRQ